MVEPIRRATRSRRSKLSPRWLWRWLKTFSVFYAVLYLLLFLLFFYLGFTRRHTEDSIEKVSSTIHRDCVLPPVSSSDLDFDSHYNAVGYIHLPEGIEFHAPPCPAEMSEYTPCHADEHDGRCHAEGLRCLVPAPYGYRVPPKWPQSRDWVWQPNVPHYELTVGKKARRLFRPDGDRLRISAGGTTFPDGVSKYIDKIGRLINLRGGEIRTVVDIGCGMGSLGAYLLSDDIITMSFAPWDVHEPQVQFALERGVPAMIGMLGSMRLPYPSRSFDMAHCSRCLTPSRQNDRNLIEVDRILRPGGYWVYSLPPINGKKCQKSCNRTREDLKTERNELEDLAKRLCWKKVAEKDDINIWQKPINHVHCLMTRRVFKKPRFCQNSDPDAAWYTKIDTCLTPLPNVTDVNEVAGGKLAKWPERLTAVPPRISSGNFEGKTAENFEMDTNLWKKKVAYYRRLDPQFAERGRYRNLLDMSADLGGFAASLIDYPVWVMNCVPVELESRDNTHGSFFGGEAEYNNLGVIFERGLIGTYQNWCEPMSTYPRSYDFIHAEAIFTHYNDRCDMQDILFEMDRILRPHGSMIIRDDVDFIMHIKKMFETMKYKTKIVNNEDGPFSTEKLLVATKHYWTAPKPDYNKIKSQS